MLYGSFNITESNVYFAEWFKNNYRLSTEWTMINEVWLIHISEIVYYEYIWISNEFKLLEK